MKKSKWPVALLFILPFISSCETAFERELEGKRVRLLAPANHVVSSDTTQTFYWETLRGASAYRLRIVSPRFDSIVTLIDDTTIESDRFIIRNMRKGNYQWEVRGVNNSSSTDQSEIWNLKIE